MKMNFEASVKNGNWNAVVDYVVGYMAIAVERSEMNAATAELAMLEDQGNANRSHDAVRECGRDSYTSVPI